MSTYTVEAFYLGVLDDLDTNEGDFDTENAASLNGTTFGSEGDPLFQRTAKLTLTDSNSGGTIRENDAGGNDEPLTYDGVASGLDSVTQYNVLVTYADGSTALTKMYLLQDESGRSFLSPSASGSADNDALDDKPIESITVQSVAEDTFSRITADLDQNAFVGQVDGTTGDDVIDASYSDADGDRVNEADTRADVIDAGAGNDTVSSGAGDDMVYGGTGDDSLDGGEGDDT
ncbi:MAG: type I secretion protein, partial [Roseovarius sp.]